MSAVLDSVNVSFNPGNVLILGTKVETDLAEGHLKRFEFWVSKSGADVKSPMLIELNDMVEACRHGGDLTVRQGFNGAEV